MCGSHSKWSVGLALQGAAPLLLLDPDDLGQGRSESVCLR